MNTLPAFHGKGHKGEPLARWLQSPTAPAPGMPSEISEWRDIVDAALRTGLAGLVLERAAANTVDIPPSDAMPLRVFAGGVARANLHRSRELERIVGWFNHHRIPVMLLKGAALNLILYDRPDLRPMSDLDLLVRFEDADRARRLLIFSGCRRGASLLRDDFFPRYYYETELYTDADPPVRIDLHARPFRPLRYSRIIADDNFWQDAKTVRIGQAVALVPSIERMFIHLAAHAAFHGCERLIWLYDLVRLNQDAGRSLDWSRIIDLARKWRLHGALHHALEKATELFGPFIPEDAADTLSAYPVDWADRLTLRQAPNDVGSPVFRLLCDLLCTPGMGFRLGYFRALLTPDPDHLASVYPHRHSGWTIVANVWRWLRVPIRMASSLMQRVRRTVLGAHAPYEPTAFSTTTQPPVDAAVPGL